MLGKIFEPFIENSPVSVMARSLLERALCPEKLDEWFKKNATDQYTKELLFSTIFELMRRVVFTSQPNIHSAFLALKNIPVSVQSVYNKINHISPETSAELVRYFSKEMASILSALQVQTLPWLDGFRVKIVDGNALASSEHRIRELRSIPSAPLPGKSLVVFDPLQGLVIDVFPCEDGHAQERSLFHQILPTVEKGDLWIEDRNFCVLSYLFGIAHKGASFVIRQHLGLPFKELTPFKSAGQSETGKLYEQKVQIESEDGEILKLRRIKVCLEKPTRDGEKEIFLLTNLSRKVASTKKVAELYRRRWTIETAFQKLEKNFKSEINTLGYPKAALFGFCVALVGYNVMAVIMGALKSVHGVKKIEEEVSEYYIAQEIGSTYRGMEIAVPSEEWRIFTSLSKTEMVEVLTLCARNARLSAFKKSKRGPKKPSPKPKWDPEVPHVSTAKLLKQRVSK